MIKLNRKLLTLDDLYRFYSTKKKSMKFDSNKSGEPIVVQVEGKMIFEQDENTEGLTAVTLQACHTEKNLNKSSISFETMQNKMLPTFKNRPILGYIHDVDGEPQFYGHNMHIDEDTDELIYDEIAVGIIPESNNARLEYDSKEDRYNVFVDGYIFNDYTKATQILEREQELSVSVEIAVKSMSYDVKTKVLNIDDGYFSGVTILGVDEEGNTIRPGMSGSNIKLKDFSESNNSIFSDMTEEDHSKLIDTLEKLNKTLSSISNFNINNDVNSLTKDYGKEENSNVENEKLVNEEVTEVEEVEETEVETTDNTVTETESTEETVIENEVTETTEDNPEVVEVEEVETVDESNTDDETETFVETKVTEGAEEVKKFSKTFELSHEDIRSALYALLAPVEEANNDWYWICQIYDNHFVYQGIMGNYWGQKYIKDNDTVAFDGERYELFAEFVTTSEKAELEKMRSNYSSIEAELNKYKEAESMADKMSIFEDESYSSYLDTEEFKQLMSEDNVKKFTKEELQEKADATLGKLVKKNKSFAFSVEKKDEKKKPYFFAFAKQESDTSFLDSLLKK